MIAASNPTLVGITIWSNGSNKRAWSKNYSDGQPSEYQYNNGRLFSVSDDNMTYSVIYQGTQFHYENIRKINTANEKALYIVKENKIWECKGIIVHAEYIDDYNWKFIIKKDADYSRPLSSNKYESLNILNLKKKMGKGTGNLNWGFCRVENR